MKKMSRVTLILILILFFSFIIRIILLNEVPPGIANDEINIIINAQSFLKTGQNIPGVVTGIFGQPKGDLSGGIHSEISSYLLIPSLIFTGFGWPWVKIPFVFFGIGIIYITFLLVKKLVNQEVGLIAAALSAINPWNIHFSRSAYESSISCFFYLLSLYLIISKKGWKILWALLFLLLGFFSYFSAKTLLLPIILIFIFAVRFIKPKESLKPIIFLNITLFLLVIIYGIFLNFTPAGGRLNELKSNPEIQKIVDKKRTESINLPFNNFFENKFTEDINQRLSATFRSLSLHFLFLNSEEGNNPALTIPDHGPLYLIDFPLIILGLIYLSFAGLPVLALILLLISVTLIPNFLNLAGTTFMIRTVILFPLLTILSACGIYYLKSLLKGSARTGATIIVTGAYLILFGNFIFQYFARLPVEKAEGWFLYQRTAVKYLKELPASFRAEVVDSDPKHFFYRYLFFNNLYTDSREITSINQNLVKISYTFSNLTVSGICPKNYNPDVIYLIDRKLNCPNTRGVYISNIKDGGDEYLIVNDKLCNMYVKKNYPLIKDFKYLDVEGLSKQDFCTNFITSHET